MLEAWERAKLSAMGIESVDDIESVDWDKRTVITKDGRERQVCSIFPRVMGYHAEVGAWNIGKRGEWAERRMFEERSIPPDDAQTREVQSSGMEPW